MGDVEVVAGCVLDRGFNDFIFFRVADSTIQAGPSLF